MFFLATSYNPFKMYKYNFINIYNLIDKFYTICIVQNNIKELYTNINILYLNILYLANSYIFFLVFIISFLCYIFAILY